VIRELTARPSKEGDVSLIDPLLRFIDPIEHREREADRRDAREARPDQPDPEIVPITPPPPAESDTRRRCRVCGHLDVSRYCMACLADTMEDLPS
jgi:hypothetical protein